MKNEKQKPIFCIIIFLTSFLLISISIVSSIGAWKNRSFYFSEYIYSTYSSSELNYYCADVYRFITKDMTEREAESFESQNNGIYYYIVNDKTKEVFTNLPGGRNYIEFSSRNNIVTLQYVNKQDSFLIRSDDEKIIVSQEQPLVNTPYTGFSGYVFIDENAGDLLTGSFRNVIKNGFNLQRILFLELHVLVISLLLGIVLLLTSYKKAIGNLVRTTDFIPIDIKLVMPIIAIALWIFLYGTYSYTIGFYSALVRRVILYVIFVLLTFMILSFSVLLILKVKQYATDRIRFNQEWETRLTKNIPPWIICLAAQLTWYFFILGTVSPAGTIYDYLAIIKSRWIMIIVHNIVIITLIILIHQIQKGKKIYVKEVLKTAQEIASGNLSEDILVVGNGSYAQIAGHINTIKAAYIHALNEQKKSDRQKYELITNISHDLRTPLTSILNYIGLVKEKGVSGDMQKYIDHAHINAKRLNILIEDLFELSKIESGNMPLEVSNTDLVLMLKQIGHEYGEKLKQNNLELILENSSPQVMYQCDSLKIWRVLDNLINNAVKYSMKGTRIYVSVAQGEEQLLISVKNIVSNKIDFEPDELFLRFKRGDDARNSDGSGLGLAIAKSIVTLHNGIISIEIEGDMFKVFIQLNKMLQ